MTTYKLSPSTLNLYVDCPTCFWGNMHGQKRPSGPFPSLPSGMDKIIKRRFDDYRKRAEMPEELSDLGGVALFNHEKLTEWQNQRKGLKWTNEKGHVLGGALDDILQTAAGELVVLDYKTRGFPLKQTPDYYTLQLECYTLLLRKEGFQTTNDAYLLFYYPDQFTEKGEVKFHHHLVKVAVALDHAEKVFAGAIELLNGKKPEKDKDCHFCLYRERE